MILGTHSVKLTTWLALIALVLLPFILQIMICGPDPRGVTHPPSLDRAIHIDPTRPAPTVALAPLAAGAPSICILLVFIIARMLFSDAIALSAAFFTALSLSISFSPFIGCPRPVYVLAHLVAWAACVWATRRPQWTASCLAGALTGLAATVQPAALVFLPVAIWTVEKRKRILLAAALIPGALAGLLLGLLPAITRLPLALAGFAESRRQWAIIDSNSDGLFSAWAMLKEMTTDLGLPIMILAGIGVLVAVSRRRREAIWAASYAALFLWTKPMSLDLGSAAWAWLVPPVGILAAVGAISITRAVGRRTRLLTPLLASIIILGASCMPVTTLLDYPAEVCAARDGFERNWRQVDEGTALPQTPIPLAALLEDHFRQDLESSRRYSIHDMGQTFINSILFCKKPPVFVDYISAGVRDFAISSSSLELFSVFPAMKSLIAQVQARCKPYLQCGGRTGPNPSCHIYKYEGPVAEGSAAPNDRPASLREYLNRNPSGSIIIMCVRGRPSNETWNQLFRAMIRIGAPREVQPHLGASFALVGIMDASLGSAVWRTGVQEVVIKIDAGEEIGSTGIVAPRRIVARSIGDGDPPGRAIISVGGANCSANTDGVNAAVIDTNGHCISRAYFQ
ncbi:hypothetical protein J7M28_12025 [bacterium]|nr:hypothetical protein [bacterium]